MKADGDNSEPASRWGRIWTELRQRRVVRTTVLYLGGAVAVVEGADAFGAPLGIPAEAIRTLAIALASGLPLVVGLAWSFDVKAADEADEARGWKLRSGFILAVLTSLSLGIGYALWSRGPDTSPPPPSGAAASGRVHRIAVLPFDVPGASGELRILADHLHGRLVDGLGDALAPGGLTDAERIRVVSRRGVQSFDSPGISVDSIARALQVQVLVEGAVETVRDSVRIRLRLVDAATADLLDTRVAAAPVDDPVLLADDLALTARQMLQERLGEVVRVRARRLSTRSADAFRAFARAEAQRDEFSSAMGVRDLTGAAEGLEVADSLFAEATRLDPEWAAPWVSRGHMSDFRANLATAEGREDELADIYLRGLAFADSALARLADDHGALHLAGRVRFRLATLTADADSASALLERAEADLRAALRNDPTPAQTLRSLSEIFERQGRLRDAVAFGARAYEEDRYLEAVDVTLLRLFEYTLRLDRDTEAAEYCAEGRARFQRPYFEDCHLMLMAWSDAVAPDADSAWAAVGRALAVYPAPLRPRLEPRLHALVAATLARTAHADSARSVLERALATGGTAVGLRVAAAGTLALLDEPDRALAQLDLLRRQGVDDEELERAVPLRQLRSTRAYRAWLEGS